VDSAVTARKQVTYAVIVQGCSNLVNPLLQMRCPSFLTSLTPLTSAPSQPLTNHVEDMP
jgi:hypothetical protein